MVLKKWNCLLCIVTVILSVVIFFCKCIISVFVVKIKSEFMT